MPDSMVADRTIGHSTAESTAAAPIVAMAVSAMVLIARIPAAFHQAFHFSLIPFTPSHSPIFASRNAITAAKTAQIALSANPSHRRAGLIWSSLTWLSADVILEDISSSLSRI